MEGGEERGHLYSAKVQVLGGTSYLLSKEACLSVAACEYVQFPRTAENKGSIALVLHLLCASQPMVHYESLEPLYAFLEVPNLPNMHWYDSSGWIMAKFIYIEVTAAIKSKV